MNQEQIYLEMHPNVKVREGTMLCVRDVATLYPQNKETQKIENRPIGRVNEAPLKISALDMVACIKQLYPQYEIQVIGGGQSLVQVMPKKPPNAILTVLKVIVVCVILFVGGAMAIMNFHMDVSMADVHREIYHFITGEKNDNPMIVSIPYSIGIGIGIAMFLFNKPGSKKRLDPNPLQLEMFLYQQDTNQYQTDQLDQKEAKNQEAQ